jgi:DNA-binding CsgD family transcriptional regulator
VLCQTAYDQGNYAAARAWGEQSLALEQKIGSPWSIAFSLTNLGKVTAAQGEYSTARDLLNRSLQIRRELGDLRGAALCLNRLGDLALAMADPVEAVELYTAALEIFRTIGNPWGIAAVLLHISRFATRHVPAAATARLLHEALELSLQTGATPQMAEIIAAFAALLQRTDPSVHQRIWKADDTASGPSEYETKAAQLLAWSAGSAPAAITLDAAIATLREAARLSTEQAATSVQPAPDYPGGLTAREVEVLRLVAQSLTDGQVAERLVLSRRTVQSHLASIYSKLAINSRSAATRFAVENGLV